MPPLVVLRDECSHDCWSRTEVHDMRIHRKIDNLKRKGIYSLPGADTNSPLIKIFSGWSLRPSLVLEMNPIDHHLQVDTVAHFLIRSATPFHRAGHHLPTGHRIVHCSCNHCNTSVLCSVVPGNSPSNRGTTGGGSLAQGGRSTAGVVGQTWMVVSTQLFAAMCLPFLFSALLLRLAHVMESASTSLHLAFHQGGTLTTYQTQAHARPITPSGTRAMRQGGPVK